MASNQTQLSLAIDHCFSLDNIIFWLRNVIVHGDELSLAELVAVSCYAIPCMITTDDDKRHRVDASVEFLENYLKEGHVVYGEIPGAKSI